jgi:ankyrin repeat protein
MAKAETLLQAVVKGSLSAVERHLKKGEDVNRMGLAGTPIYAAATGGDLAIARVLLAAGADVNLGPLETPLQRAIQRGHFELALLLLEARADVNRTPSPGVPPALALAAAAGSVELVRALLAAGARRNLRSAVRIVRGDEASIYQNVTALHVAAYRGDAAVAAELLSAGADPAVTDGLEKTVFEVAETSGNDALKALFLAL